MNEAAGTIERVEREMFLQGIAYMVELVKEAAVIAEADGTATDKPGFSLGLEAVIAAGETLLSRSTEPTTT